MFQTFTGSSRRPRQVNLSGRNPNPFATLGNASGSQAALASAQQERERRQRERERQNAAKLIQRSWRGATCRNAVNQSLRAEWDAAELHNSDSSAENELQQLRRLLRFFSPRNKADIQRLQGWASRHLKHVQDRTTNPAAGPWPMTYLRLEKTSLAALERISREGIDDTVDILLQLLVFLTNHGPDRNLQQALRYFSVVREVTEYFIKTNHEPISSILNATTAPLRKITARTLYSYEAFACRYLASQSLLSPWYLQKLLPTIADKVNYKLLASALAAVVRSPRLEEYPELTDSRTRLSLLSFFIYFHRHTHNFGSSEPYSSSQDFVTVASVLLGSIADDFDLDEPLPDEVDFSTRRSSSQREHVSDSFIKEQIRSLVQRENVGALLRMTGQSSSSPNNSSATRDDGARQLAIYALSLLRFFPRHADEIRMWLFRGSSQSSTPAIKYFWSASRDTEVFRAIYHDSRAAMKLLKDPSSVQKQDYQPPTSSSRPSESLRDDWRVILVFLELYTFVLKVMDDDEFFSASNVITNRGADESSSVRDNALPLDDVKELSVFLKNLGFTMYFNAAQIVEDNDAREAPATLSSYFNTSNAGMFEPAPETKRSSPSGPSIGGISGMSIDYMKGLVTGLLRMIYERDSRRKFLPPDHWLLTSRLDMDGFIPAVVTEEESRNKVRTEDDEDVEEDEEEDVLGPDSDLIGSTRVRQIRAQERLRRQQRKASRRRYLQAVAPRLEILQNMPFVIPFTTRVQIFREFVRLDQYKRRDGLVDPELWRLSMNQDMQRRNQLADHHASIRRGHEFEDAYTELYELKEKLKEPIQVSFVDKFGQIEAGIDGGGVTKEFLTSVTSQAFSPCEGLNMFSENEHHLLFPNPSAVEEKKELLRQSGFRENSPEFREEVNELLRRYEFLGRVIGKCLYEGILVDIHFAGFFLLKWALTGGEGSAPNESGYRANINDLRDLDEALYQGLLQLKRYPGKVDDFSLDFTIADTISLPGSEVTKTITKDLISGGSSMAVTNENRLIYISYVAQHRLSRQPWQQTMAFLRGLSSMIQPSWLSMFNQSELQTLIGGTAASISVADLKANTQYGGVYQIGDDGLLHPTIELFWRVMEGFEDNERRAVLKFVTSTPNAPLLGFGSLNPKFSIRDSGDDQSRLPSTSTCVNLLKLPRYSNEKVLKERLLYAAFSGAGFDLS
ncbi:hypothetical protein NA57DRAFT_30302 [Rhizodiscina lignyota]|uniref:HECT-type E3 ubiquitin transferase n=1 Tax=Rhizodiscina lignyota TaxID=1504668 RepID=A0A9P4IRU3_9PEZI|nr:hypothetical protein NA57DRAFT_30302 [Rhizodiscina lignyota]